MKSFNLNDVALITKNFISKNQRLGYLVELLETDEHHALCKATNLFSLLYCQITSEIPLIKEWPALQERLFEEGRKVSNRYLVYLFPDSQIKHHNLYEDLARAERDDRFFRKIFIGIPDRASKHTIETALADRIPLWFEDTTQAIREHVPVLSDVIPDAELLEILKEKQPSAVIKAIEKQPGFSYLLESEIQSPRKDSGLRESAEVGGRYGRGTRITGLTVEDFRRFEKVSLDLDGDVILIYGRNGTGKTTICDALELSIFPGLQRLQWDPDVKESTRPNYQHFIRTGSTTGYARIGLAGTKEKAFALETTVTETSIQRAIDGASESEESVVKFITGSADIQKEGVLDILRYTHFLGQHSIRDFIYGSRRDSNKKITTTRYDLLAEMFGFGEVEQLKKRLTKVLGQIQRKITEAENRMSEVRDQIRTLQRRYPEKSRKDLRGKGYDIKPQPTIQKYDQLMNDLANLLSTVDIKRVKVGDKPLMEDYLESCRKVKTLLNAEAKSLEAEASDLKRFGRLMARLRSLLSDSILLDTSSTVKIIEGVRRHLDSSLERARNDEREVDTIERRADALKDSVNGLQLFLVRHSHYLQLLKAEKEALTSLASVQEKRNEFLNQQRSLLDRLTQATANEHELEERVSEKEQLLGRYARWLTSIPEIWIAEHTLQDYENQIIKITDTIDKTEKRLAELEKTLGPRYISQVTPESVLNLESLRTDNDYYCPCCGNKYAKIDLEGGIKSQLVQGKYSKELRRFLIELERSNSESLRSHLLETLKTHNDENAKLQNLAAEQRAILAGFSRISEQFDAAQTQSEDEVREAYIEHKIEVEQMQKALANHDAKKLRKEAEGIRLALTDLQYEERERHLSEVRREISDLTKPIDNLTDLKDLGSVEVLQSRLNLLMDELLAQNVKRDRLVTGIKEADLSARKVRELDEILGELESLSLSQETLRDHRPGQADFLTADNLSKQATNYRLASDTDDLSRLFGLLTVEERTGSLTASIKTHNDNIARWRQCYENFESMNASLSTLSHVGLQKSLDEYGPLINQIYQKFIRHDIFAALVLKPKVSRRGYKHDLYLRLKRYSGEEEYTPASYLSEAQLNILALSIFLTRARYQRISVLDTIFIDDPIQQMDDMNAAAFVDVMVGLSQIGKQIIITTCDQDFFRLVAYKMRSVADTGTVSFKTLNLDSGALH